MAAWFTATIGGSTQLYKLGVDENPTQWTANPGSGGGLNPQDLTAFNGAVWFSGDTPELGQQLFKLGADGSVTKWTDIGFGVGGVGVGVNPEDMTVFNNALWFKGNNLDGEQLYKLGADGSVTKWTAI